MINKAQLKRALTAVNLTTRNKVDSPAQLNVKVVIKNGWLYFECIYTYDSAIAGFRVDHDDIEFIVNRVELARVLTKARTKQVRFSLDGNDAIVHSKSGGQAGCHRLPMQQMAIRSEYGNHVSTFVVDRESVKGCLAKAAVHLSNDPYKGALKDFNLVTDDTGLTIHGSDGHTASRFTCSFIKTPVSHINMTVSAKLVKAINAMHGDEIMFQCFDSGMRVSSEGFEYRFKHCGPYAGIDRVIPATNDLDGWFDIELQILVDALEPFLAAKKVNLKTGIHTQKLYIEDLDSDRKVELDATVYRARMMVFHPTLIMRSLAHIEQQYISFLNVVNYNQDKEPNEYHFRVLQINLDDGLVIIGPLLNRQKPLVDFDYSYDVPEDKPELSQKIVVTGTYQTDMRSARAQGLFPHNVKKEVLYAAIDKFNAAYQASQITVKQLDNDVKAGKVIDISDIITAQRNEKQAAKQNQKPDDVAPIVDTSDDAIAKAKAQLSAMMKAEPASVAVAEKTEPVVESELETSQPEPKLDKKAERAARFAQWQEKQQARKDKRSQASKPKAPRQKLNKPAAKCLNWEEVWPQDAIGYVKADSHNGRVLAALVDGVTLDDYEKLGCPTKRQVSQALACISEKGYGVKKDGKTYTLILPEGMTEPRLK